MATKSQIVITFTRAALQDEYVQFFRADDATLTAIPMLSTFVSGARVKNGEVPIGTPTGTPGEAEAVAYEKYFDIDFNAAGLMSISRVGAVVTVDININWFLTTFTSTAGATETINTRIPEDFTLASANLKIHPTTPCDIVDVEIDMTQLADGYSYSLAVGVIPVSTNPFTVPVNRTVPTNIYVHKSGKTSVNIVSEQWNEQHLYFRKLYAGAGIHIQIQPSPLVGATVTIQTNYAGQLEQRPPNTYSLTYSLDDITYQSSNIFTGQADGDYTVYIKDSLGCTVEKDYTIVGGGANGRDEFFEVSNVNSITFSKDEIWDGLQNGIHKNLENVLSLTGTSKIQFEEKLIYSDSDEVRIQFKSNYKTHNVTAENCEGDDTGLTVVVEKMSKNLDLFESLDAKMYSINQDFTALYFTSGNVYDEAGVIIDTFELNGNLPNSAIVGVDVEIIGEGVHEIVDVIYDSEKDKNVMVFNFYLDSGEDVDVRMRAYYDLLPFEVYEFTIPFGDVIIHGDLAKEIRLRIQAADDLYDEINHYSEYISLLTAEELGLNKYVAINYFNNNNRDIFYLYGISHFIRAEVLDSNAIIDDSSEVIKGDLTTYLTESVVHNGIAIIFSEVTYRVMLKIVLALSSEGLFINGLGYVKKEGIDVEPIKGTNLYAISCELLSTNKNFNTFIDSDTGEGEDYITTYYPRLLTSGGGSYIKI